MTTSPQLSIVPIGMSLGIFFVVTYLLCILYGFAASAESMHQLISMLIPGFTWISWGSFFLGFVLSFAYGWYVAIVFAPLYNLFVARNQK
jgi:hypothetical protein